MKYTKVAILFCCIILVGSVLSGCVSQEAKEVINDIDALGEITLDSLQDLQAINEKYDALSEEDKASVSNVDLLEAANQRYNELKYADLDSRIGEACQNVSSDTLSNLEDLHAEYEELTEEGKAAISNYTSLLDAISESKALWAKEVTSEILSCANGSLSTAKSMLNEYYEIMSESQIEKCLIEIGRWDAVSEAEDYLKDYLKNPRSYVRYSGKCGTPELQSDGTYKTYVYLDYGAENSFGASVRDEVEMYVYFKINIDSLIVRFSKTEFTAYYKWQFS